MKNGFQILPIGFEDVLQLTALTFFHKDPFDRLIIAQAITNKLQVISKDQYFTEYPINVIWWNFYKAASKRVPKIKKVPKGHI